MDYETIKDRVAPCGLHCGKCFAYKNGEIVKLSRELKSNLGDLSIYAQRFVELLDKPVFKYYSDFKELLDYFAEAECSGCRNEVCRLFKNCKVRLCSEVKRVDFCFQCPEFPCNQTGFDEHLNKRSVDINERIREIGIEVYYNEIKDKPRY